MIRHVETAAFAVIALVATTAPAWAGVLPPATPAPVLGLGLPAVALFGLAYRKLRNRRDD